MTGALTQITEAYANFVLTGKYEVAISTYVGYLSVRGTNPILAFRGGGRCCVTAFTLDGDMHHFTFRCNVSGSVTVYVFDSPLPTSLRAVRAYRYSRLMAAWGTTLASPT